MPVQEQEAAHDSCVEADDLDVDVTIDLEILDW
jgi:hypothetical protein